MSFVLQFEVVPREYSEYLLLDVDGELGSVKREVAVMLLPECFYVTLKMFVSLMYFPVMSLS